MPQRLSKEKERFTIYYMYIKKDDTVIVLTGSDRKKTGTVLRVLRDREAVIVSGVNVRTVHRKPRAQGEKGTREKIEKPVHVSNVALVDPKEKIATRVGYSGVGSQKKRIARKSGTPISSVSVKKSKKEKTTPPKKNPSDTTAS